MRRRWHAIVFCVAEAALVLMDALFGDGIALTSGYLVPVLVLALVAGRRTIMVAGLVAVGLALLSGGLHDTFLDTRHIVRVLIVLVGVGAAYAFASIRVSLGGELVRERGLTDENAYLLDAMQARERELAAVIAGIPDAVLVHDAAGVSVYANQAAADVLGLPDAQAILDAGPGDIPGRFEFHAPDGGPIDLATLPGRRIFAGDLHPPDLLARSVDRDTRRERWTVTKATAILGPDGRPTLAVNVIQDVTEERHQQFATQLLAEAGDVLGQSLEVTATLDRLVALVVPRFADWCSVDLPTGREVRAAAAAHADPRALPDAEATLRRHPAHRDEEFGVAAVLRGEPSFVRADLTRERLASYAHDEQHLDALVASGLRHLMMVGMRVAGETIGALTFVRGVRRPAFSEDEVRLAEELARRAGTAVLNAQLYTARTEVADTLQRSLLPPELPQPGGVTMAAHYRATGGASQAGGDFYDAFPVPDGWLIAIGDVTGKGPAAAALTGLARSALEGVATLTGRPALALAHLNGLLARRGDMALASVAALHLRAGTTPPIVSVFSAGHPEALLLREGDVLPIDASGPLLGAFAGAQRWDAVDVELQVGDVIVLRTDGVTDSVGTEGRLGEARLRAALAGATPGDAAGAVARVRELVAGHEAGTPRDDVAVVAVALTGTPIGAPLEVPGATVPSLAVAVALDANAGSVARARAIVDRHLRGLLPDRLLADVRLMVSELASNAVRHSGGESYSLAFDLDPLRLRIEVADRGPGPVAAAGTRARDELPEGGYGLGIVDRLSSRWGIERRPGTHPTRIWLELTRPDP